LPFFILAIVLSSQRKAQGSKHRQYNGQNKKKAKDRNTDNTMAKIKKGKRRMIYKTLHRKLNIEQHELHLKPAYSTFK
jgi:hypothetical protein